MSEFEKKCRQFALEFYLKPGKADSFQKDWAAGGNPDGLGVDEDVVELAAKLDSFLSVQLMEEGQRLASITYNDLDAYRSQVDALAAEREEALATIDRLTAERDAALAKLARCGDVVVLREQVDMLTMERDAADRRAACADELAAGQRASVALLRRECSEAVAHGQRLTVERGEAENTVATLRAALEVRVRDYDAACADVVRLEKERDAALKERDAALAAADAMRPALAAIEDGRCESLPEFVLYARRKAFSEAREAVKALANRYRCAVHGSDFTLGMLDGVTRCHEILLSLYTSTFLTAPKPELLSLTAPPVAPAAPVAAPTVAPEVEQKLAGLHATLAALRCSYVQERDALSRGERKMVSVGDVQWRPGSVEIDPRKVIDGPIAAYNRVISDLFTVLMSMAASETLNDATGVRHD